MRRVTEEAPTATCYLHLHGARQNAYAYDTPISYLPAHPSTPPSPSPSFLSSGILGEERPRALLRPGQGRERGG
eukprot:scaffold190553_cov33-Tisochrysis_lutea.AAC.1